MSVVKSIPIQIISKELAIIVSDKVRDTWHKYRQLTPNSIEACGILIGGYDNDLQTIYIEQCTKPGRQDKRSRFGFLLQSLHHQRAANKFYKQSSGKQFYLGTWHTHPQQVPVPSEKDKRDWKKCINRNRSIDLFVFAIVGKEVIHLYSYSQ